MADTCTHLDGLATVTPSADGCEDCLRIGGRWVHLRLCMHCGHVGCCDNSPNRHATAHWHEHGDHSVDQAFDWETAMRDGTMICGSPAHVRERLARLVEVSGCNYVACSFAWGTLPHEQTLKSLNLFASEVMPAFQQAKVREPAMAN